MRNNRKLNKCNGSTCTICKYIKSASVLILLIYFNILFFISNTNDISKTILTKYFKKLYFQKAVNLNFSYQ